MTLSVIAGLNGSPESGAAALWASDEAASRGLPLRLVYAWEWSPPSEDAALLAELRDHTDRMLGEAAHKAAARHPGLTTTTEHLERSPLPALLDLASEAELLVLGSRALGVVSGFVSGSVALGTAARSTVPVVLVRGPEEPGPTAGRVVVGLGPVEPSDELLGFAFDAAERRSAALEVIHCWRPSSAYEHARLGRTTRESAARDAEAEQAAAGRLAPWRAKYPRLPVRLTTPRGPVAPALVEAAQGADLLAVGRGPAGSHAFGVRLGHTIHGVLHHASCPVAVVPLD